MIIAGLDLSLTSTGVAVLNWPGKRWQASVQRLVPGKEQGHGHERLSWLLKRIAEATSPADIVVLEGASFGSTQEQHRLGGLWWLTAHGLWKRRQPYAVVPPSSLKKYVAGNGGAHKDKVLATVVRRYPCVEVSGNDEADALALAVMCADYYGCPVPAVAAAQRAVLAKVSWPIASWKDSRAESEGQGSGE